MPSEEPKEKQKVRGKDYFNQVINYAIESAKKAKEASQKESDTEKPNISKIVDSSLASSPESVVYFIRELVNSLYRIGDQARDLFPEVITSVSRAHNDIQSGNLSSYAILHNLLRSNVRLNYFDESIIQPTLDKIAQAQGPEDYHDFVFQFNDDIKQREDSQYLLALDNMVVIANQLPSLGQLDSKSKPTFKLPTIKMDHVDFVGQLKEKAKEKGEMDFNLNGSGVQYITDFATAVYLGDPDYVVDSNDPDSLLANYQQLVPTVLEKLSNPALVALTLLETRHHAYESLKKVESDGLLPYRPTVSRIILQDGRRQASNFAKRVEALDHITTQFENLVTELEGYSPDIDVVTAEKAVGLTKQGILTQESPLYGLFFNT